MIKRTIIIASLMLSFMSVTVSAQQLPDCSTVPLGTPCNNNGNIPANLVGPQMTPSQAEAFQKLTTEQRKTVESAIQQKDGALTPDAIEALKTKPEFQGLTPKDILQGKEMLEKKGLKRRSWRRRSWRRRSKNVRKRQRSPWMLSQSAEYLVNR